MTDEWRARLTMMEGWYEEFVSQHYQQAERELLLEQRPIERHDRRLVGGEIDCFTAAGDGGLRAGGP